MFGSDEVNHESWNALTRLVGHTAGPYSSQSPKRRRAMMSLMDYSSDIIDIAWSRDDSMMASVGLDKMVWIWDGYSFGIHAAIPAFR